MRKPQTRADFISILEKELLNFGVADRNEIIADFELHFEDSIGLGLSEAEICDKLGDISEIASQYGDDYIHPAVAAKPPKAFDKPDDVRIPAMTEIPVVTPERYIEPASANPLVLDTFTEIEDVIANAPVHPEAKVPEITEVRDENNEETKETIKTEPVPNADRQKESHKEAQFGFNLSGLIKVIIIDILILSWALPTVFSVFLSLLSIPIALITGGIGALFGGFFPLFSNFTSPFSRISTLFLGIAMLALGGLTSILGIKLISLCVKIMRGVINWHTMSVLGRNVFEKK